MSVTIDNIESKTLQAKKLLAQEKEANEAVTIFSLMANDNSIVSKITIDIPGSNKPVSFASNILPAQERGALIGFLMLYFQNLATSKRTEIDALFD